MTNWQLVKNDPAQLAKARERTKQHKRKSRLKGIEYLGGKCAICGRDDVPLQFDHRDPNDKQERAVDLWGRRWDFVVALLWKFQLLCERCHEQKTLDNDEYSFKRDRPLRDGRGAMVKYDDDDEVPF